MTKIDLSTNHASICILRDEIISSAKTEFFQPCS